MLASKVAARQQLTAIGAAAVMAAQGRAAEGAAESLLTLADSRHQIRLHQVQRARPLLETLPSEHGVYAAPPPAAHSGGAQFARRQAATAAAHELTAQTLHDDEADGSSEQTADDAADGSPPAEVAQHAATALVGLPGLLPAAAAPVGQFQATQLYELVVSGGSQLMVPAGQLLGASTPVLQLAAPVAAAAANAVDPRALLPAIMVEAGGLQSLDAASWQLTGGSAIAGGSGGRGVSQLGRSTSLPVGRAFVLADGTQLCALSGPSQQPELQQLTGRVPAVLRDDGSGGGGGMQAAVAAASSSSAAQQVVLMHDGTWQLLPHSLGWSAPSFSTQQLQAVAPRSSLYYAPSVGSPASAAATTAYRLLPAVPPPPKLQAFGRGATFAAFPPAAVVTSAEPALPSSLVTAGAALQQLRSVVGVSSPTAVGASLGDRLAALQRGGCPSPFAAAATALGGGGGAGSTLVPASYRDGISAGPSLLQQLGAAVLRLPTSAPVTFEQLQQQLQQGTRMQRPAPLVLHPAAAGQEQERRTAEHHRQQEPAGR